MKLEDQIKKKVQKATRKTIRKLKAH